MFRYALLLIVLGATAASAADSKHPNVLLIITDDVGYFLKQIVGKFAVLTQKTGILASFLVSTGNIGILANSGQLAAINYILLHHTEFGINE